MRKGILRYVVAACCLLAGSAHCQAGVVTFGSGANQFNMEFVTIGNPGNAADTKGSPNPSGRVDYEYGIGKYEVSRDMVNKYNASFGVANSLVITLNNQSSLNSPNKPASGVGWNEAARFVNWLNTSTNGFAAYKFTTSGIYDNISVWNPTDTLDYDPTNLYRSKRAKYVLPSNDEWYKAAYYNPSNDQWSDWPGPSGPNGAPRSVKSGTEQGTAVYAISENLGPADVDKAGGITPYGVMGLAGNIAEHLETSSDFMNSNGTYARLNRGGYWYVATNGLHRRTFSNSSPEAQTPTRLGFRVVSLSSPSGGGGGEGGGGGGGEVPEPSTMAIFGLGALGMVLRSRRRKST